MYLSNQTVAYVFLPQLTLSKLEVVLSKEVGTVMKDFQIPLLSKLFNEVNLLVEPIVSDSFIDHLILLITKS